MYRRQEHAGFTLVELMIAVVIIGILAAVALPAFVSYTTRAKTSEAVNNLKAMFTHANAYYGGHRVTPGLAANMVGNCIVDGSAGTTPAMPGPEPQLGNFVADPSFRALGVPSAENIYYGYGIDSPGTACGLGALNLNVYTFYSVGDLDGDGTQSRFELACGTDDAAQLYRAPGFYVQNELE